MVKLKPYPAYKDSGVPWLGTVPKHWAVQPNRALFVEVNDRNHPEEEMLSVTINRGVMRQKSFLAASSKKDGSNQDKTAYKLVLPGDLVYNKMRAWQGAVGVSDYRGIVSPAYVVVRPRGGQNARYYHYLLRTPAFAKEAERWSYGITSDQWSLRPEHFRAIYCAVPPVGDQQAIVYFLEHMERPFRRYVHAKQKQMALLNEQKQTVIHRAVTKGLDPSVPPRPTGVDWLERVPVHWGEVQLGRCLNRIDQGWSPVAAEGELSPNQWAVLTLSSVKKGFFHADAVKPVPLSARIPAGIEVVDGDLLLTRSNSRELVGDVCIASGVRPRTLLSDLIYRLAVDPAVLNPRFLMYQLLSPVGRRHIERDARGSSGSMPKISQKHIRAWKVLVPPLEEQDRIVIELDAILGDLYKAFSNLDTEVRAVREYRIRLITDVVTGKLDVREAAANFHDELNPLETEDFGDESENLEDETRDPEEA